MLWPQAVVPSMARQLLRLQSLSTAASVSQYQVLVGLELHVQVQAATKLFSGAQADYGAKPNSRVSTFDIGMPGTLPVFNRRCLEAAVHTGLAVGGTINSLSHFDRKHYFYGDLPHGYQITQHRSPVVSGGKLDIPLKSGVRSVAIQQIQLEMDTGKSTNDSATHRTLLDFNRAGCALMEIVTGPDLRSGEEAASFVRTFQHLLQHIGSSDGNMEEGSLRVDVNVSVAHGETGSSSNRVEVKNLNSLQRVVKAVDYEVARHTQALESGGRIQRETRGFDVASGKTFPLRDKEAAVDYRFMPEPDLPPLAISAAELARLRASLPELPDATLQRIVVQYGLAAGPAGQLVADGALLGLFERVMAAAATAKHALKGSSVANWLIGDVVRAARAVELDLAELPESASANRLAQVLQLAEGGSISGRQAKDATNMLVQGDARDLADIVTAVGGQQISNTAHLVECCREILKEYPEKVAAFRGGRTRMMGMFVGELMKRTQGRADPRQAPEIFKRLIAELPDTE